MSVKGDRLPFKANTVITVENDRQWREFPTTSQQCCIFRQNEMRLQLIAITLSTVITHTNPYLTCCK